ncbi:MAG: MerR family transcriptional regulator [Pseudomonadota bacterium]
MEKSRQAFRTISEVADGLGTQPHVLRFWESKFPQVKPVKRAGGRRYYRPADIDLLGGIKQLLHEDGMTIKGVQKVLRDRGVKYVAAIGAREEPSRTPETIEGVVVPLEIKGRTPEPAPGADAAPETPAAPEPPQEKPAAHAPVDPAEAQATDATGEEPTQKPLAAPPEAQLANPVGLSRINALRRAAHAGGSHDAEALARSLEKLKTLAARMKSAQGPW